ncbi:MAG: hypothetical protein ACLQIB_31685 [Isosphaeraceae bacterium]
MVRALQGAGCRISILALLALGSGCTMVPRSQVAECQRAQQTLHTENARLKDRVLVYQTQNRDYADRAVDDSRRLAAQDETIDQLRQSVRGYRSDISRLEAAFKQLTANLGDLGTSTALSRPWPPSGARRASAANQNEPGSRSPNTSSPDDAARVR